MSVLTVETVAHPRHKVIISLHQELCGVDNSIIQPSSLFDVIQVQCGSILSSFSVTAFGSTADGDRLLWELSR